MVWVATFSGIRNFVNCKRNKDYKLPHFLCGLVPAANIAARGIGATLGDAKVKDLIYGGRPDEISLVV